VERDGLDRAPLARMLDRVRVHRDLVKPGGLAVAVLAREHIAIERPARRRGADARVREPGACGGTSPQPGHVLMSSGNRFRLTRRRAFR
jgi:hypothetical protein